MATPTGLLVLTELAGNPPIQLGVLQQLLAPHAQLLTIGWIMVWCATGLYMLWIAFVRKDR